MSILIRNRFYFQRFDSIEYIDDRDRLIYSRSYILSRKDHGRYIFYSNLIKEFRRPDAIKFFLKIIALVYLLSR